MMKLIFVPVLALATACTTVTINPRGQQKLETPPTYETSLPFFLDGVVGVQQVDVKQICGNKSVKQMQTQSTFMDSFLSIVTLTIYSPRSVKVWCAPERS